MSNLLTVLYLLGVSASVHCRTELSGTYAHSLTFSDGGVEVYWKFTDTDITFEVHGNTTGWIGIGLSPNGAMSGADMVVGWIKDGTVKISDRHGPPGGNTFPPLDPKQDINILGGAECDGWTMFKFSRQLAACEDDYDREISSATERLIWAFGVADPEGEDIAPEHYHGPARGAKSVYLLSPTDESKGNQFEGPQYQTFDVTAKDFALPAVKTHYNCRIIPFPKLDKKHHIIGFDPVIQPGHEKYVHHILVSACNDEVTSGAWKINEDYECPVNDLTNPCVGMLAGWAVGGTGMLYPDAAGFSIGDTADMKYVRIQTHYDNPEMNDGVVDSSGLRFIYTSKLRKYDTGVIAVGEYPSQAGILIPPGAENFVSSAYCSSKCIEDRMGVAEAQEFTIFGSLLHSHLAGRAMTLRHIRNGVEVPYIDDDKSYDFDYQETRLLEPPVLVKAGDEMRLDCVYNTAERTGPTLGGEATDEEMCIAFLNYYPKIDFSRCVSVIQTKVLWRDFGIEAFERNGPDYLVNSYTVTAPENLAGTPVREILMQYNWTSEKIAQYEKDFAKVKRMQYCSGNDASTVSIFGINVTEIVTPYFAPRKNCIEPSSPLNQTSGVSECSVAVTGAPVTTTSGSLILTASSRVVLFLTICTQLKSFM